jgi:indolepyruvate ferredoxin oxidoreductase, alpha subunit
MGARYGWEILTETIRAADLDLVVCVPGKPVTPVQDALVASGEARWVNHEAAAAQIAAGAAGTGARTALLVKQVGMNVAADVLGCAAPHRTGGSFVVIVGDDPNTVSSQVEGDSRQLARALDLSCFEPAGGEDFAATLRLALATSTALEAPVVFRVTTPMVLLDRVEASVPARLNLPAVTPFDNDHWQTNFTGHRQLLLEGMRSLPTAQAAERRAGTGRVRVVASGLPAAIVRRETDLDLLTVKRVNPLPTRAIAEYVGASDAPILVLEESGPLLEDEVRTGAIQTLGRRSGHVAWAGPVDVHASLAAALEGDPVPAAPPPPYDIAPAADLGPFGDLWEAAAEMGLTPIAVDAGHCGEAVALDSGVAPLSYGLGSAVGVAAGVSLAKGAAAIAVTGDMGAFHALPGLVQVVRDQLPVLIVIEDDGAATTTGGQPTPSARPSAGEQEVPLSRLLAGVGIGRIESVTREAMTGPGLRMLLRELVATGGPAAIVINEKTA